MIEARAVVLAASIAWSVVAVADEPIAGEPSVQASTSEPAADASTADKAKAAEPKAEEILNGSAPLLDYSQAVKCLKSENIERTEPIGDRYIVFHLRGNETWIAQMRHRCPQMGPYSKLMFVKNNPRICEWDEVRVVRDDGDDEYRLGPPCNLPKFEPVSREQVEMLKQSILNAGKSSLKSAQ